MLLAAALLFGVAPAVVQAQDVVLSVESVTVPEDGSRSESYGVRLTALPSGETALTLTLTLTGGGAKVEPRALQFTSASHRTYQYVKVTGIPDKVDNSNDRREVSISHEAAGVTTKTLPVVVTDDDTAGLTLNPPEPRLTVYEEGTPDYFEVKLNSAPPAGETLTVTVSAMPTGIVTVNGANTVDLTFGDGDWDKYQQIRVAASADSEDNPNDSRPVAIEVNPADEYGYGKVETVRIPGTVIDDDTAEIVISPDPADSDPTKLDEDNGADPPVEETKTYKVKLRTQPSGPVTVAITSMNLKLATTTASLTFQPTVGACDPASGDTGRWCADQDVTVTSVPDEVDNGDRSVLIKHVATGGGYDGVTAEKTVTIVDNDTADLELGSPPTVTEGGASVGITAVLGSEPTSRVTVTVRSTDTYVKVSKTETGTPASSITLSFTTDTWDEAQTVYVSGEYNKIEETSRSVDVSFMATGGGYSGIKKLARVTVSNGTDDVSGLTVGTPTVTETTSGSYTVVPTDTTILTGNHRVTVTVRSSDPTKGAKVSTADELMSAKQSVSLTFDSTNSGAQTIYVFGVNNNIAASRDVIITHRASGIPADSGTGRHDIVVSVTNNSDPSTGDVDAPDVTIDTSGLDPIREMGGRDTYTVKIDSEPTADVIVDVVNPEPATVTVSPQSLTFTSGNWRSPKSVTVTGVNDDEDNSGDRREVTITHAVRGGSAEYATVTADPVRVTVTDDDRAGLTVVPTDLRISRGREDTFTVKLNSKPTGDVTVTPMVTPSSVASVRPSTLTFTSTNWDMPQVVTVTGGEDSGTIHIGGERDARIKLAVTGAYVATPGYVYVTVTDEDVVVVPPGLTLAPTSLTISEGQTDTYTVKLNARPRGSVTVTAASSDEAAATVSPESRTFTPGNWNTAQEFTVTGVAGSDSPVAITNAASGIGYENVSESVSVTVRAAGLVLSTEAVTVTEAPGAGQSTLYTVGPRTQPTGTVTVTVESGDSSIATVSPARLIFTTSDWAAKTITVTGVPDAVDNVGNRRAVTITHTPSGPGYSPSSAEQLRVTVTDDDAAPEGINLSVSPETVNENDTSGRPITVTARVTGGTYYGTAKQVTVNVGAAGDSATGGTDYREVAPFVVTIATGAPSGTGTFTLTPIDDRVYEVDEFITVAGGEGVTGTRITLESDDPLPTALSITGTSVGEGAAAPLAFTVRASSEAGTRTEVVTVNYAVAGGTATAGTDYEALPAGTLTFQPGEATKTIYVTVTDDDVDEIDETVEIALSSPVNARLAPDMSRAEGTIEDDDPEPELSIEGATVEEGHEGAKSPLVFTVTKDGATSKEVTVGYAVAGGTATSGTDYEALPAGTLTFQPRETTKTINVTVKGDVEPEGSETIEIRLSNPTNATFAEGMETAMATITDDDLALLPIDDVPVTEGGEANIVLRLERALQVPVRIGYSAAGSATAGEDYTFSVPVIGLDLALPQGAIEVPAGEQQGVVTVAAVEDSLVEGREEVTVTLTTVTTDGSAPDMLGQVTVTIEDNDELSVSVTAPKTVAEGDVARFTVRVGGGESTAPVDVNYSVGGTAKAPADYTAPSPTMVSIPAGQRTATITIRTMADKVLEPDETLKVTLTGAQTANGTVKRPNSSATILIQDSVFHSVNRVNQALLPGITRASAAGALDAVSTRMALAAQGDSAATADLSGLTGLYRALQANEYALQDGSYDLAKVLGGSSFLVPLSSHDGPDDGGVGVAVWGGGDFRTIGGGDVAAVKWDGSVWSARLGADLRFVDSLLAGLVVSWTGGGLEYTDEPSVGREGTYASWLISVHPYMGWSSTDFGLWATGGFGFGGVSIDDGDEDYEAQESDLTQWSLGAGSSVTLLSTELFIAGGTTALKLKAEGSLAGASVAENEAKTIQHLDVGVSQARAAIEASHAQHFAGGGSLKPALEIGGRLDGGDGETGAGLEVGGGVTYADRGSRITVSAGGRGLLVHGGDYGEWGLSGLIQLDSNAAGHGLSMSVRPTWGVTDSRVDGLWEQGTIDLLADSQPGGRVQAEIGYGLPAFGGILTPYSSTELAFGGQRSYRVGARLELDRGVYLSAEGTRKQPPRGDAEQHFTVRLRLLQ